MKISKEIWTAGKNKTVYPYNGEPLPFNVPTTHEVNSISFDQKITHYCESDDQITVYVNSKRPAVLIDLEAFHVRYGLNRFLDTYKIEYNKASGKITYKAYAVVAFSPVTIPEMHKFKYVGVNYNVDGSPIGDLDIYINCSFETLQLWCARAGSALPRDKIIVDVNDLINIKCDVNNIYIIKSVTYQDIRTFDIL